ncbi:flippase [Acidithiobacillus caldus]|uniref:Polysaccharide biosynthesis protein n=1 Tax=Acidithiobacillus caldus (strain SM-1) TaxID=990288 RepID=F9ZQA0_ACICS|nr:flippase [Acidithiobacillus caldus]AEK56875.1 polysaccharide biosynthesis protein [Acidithiobacillus caldus SM-1]
MKGRTNLDQQSTPKNTNDAPDHPRISRSTLINLIGALVPTVLVLFTVPAYLHLIGEARYGVLAIVWLLLGYFGVFDLGFGRAVANRIAALHDSDAEQRQRVFWTGLVISAITGITGGAILYLVGDWLFTHVLDIHGALRVEAENAMPWLALGLPLAVIISLLAGTLEGRQAFLALNGAQVFGTVLYQIFPLAVAYAGWKTLPHLIAAALVGRLMSALLLFALSYRYVPLLARPCFAADQAKSLLQYGSWITVTGLIGPLLTVFDRFLIGTKVGMVAVTAYTVPYNLVMRLTILPSSLQTALFPRFAMMEQTDAKALATRAVLSTGAIMTPITVMGLLLIKPFLILWVGGALADKIAAVGQILLVGIWINTLAFIPFAYLQARGRPDLPAKFHLLELLPYVAILWVLIDKLGVPGAAWAWNLRVLADTVLLFWAAQITSGINHTIAGALPIIAAFFVAFRIANDSTLYICIALPLIGVSIGWSIASIQQDQRSTLKRLLFTRLNPVKSPRTQNKHGL